MRRVKNGEEGNEVWRSGDSCSSIGRYGIKIMKYRVVGGTSG